MPAAEVVILLYGALASGLGLTALAPLRARSACRVAFPGARAGFGRYATRADRYEAVLDLPGTPAPPVARELPAHAPPPADPEGLALAVGPVALGRLADRLGYSSGALGLLADGAARAGVDLAAHLWTELEQTGFDVPAFRARLHRRLGYTSPHALPHPVRLAEGRYALTFLVPGEEGTGSARVVPARVRAGAAEPLTLAAAWSRKPHRGQLAYLVACLLAGAHGIAVGDLVTSAGEVPPLAAALRAAVAAEMRHELPRLLAATGLAAGAYFAAVGPASAALARGGLDRLLRGCIANADA